MSSGQQLFLLRLNLAPDGDRSKLEDLHHAEADAVFAIAAEDRLEAIFLLTDQSGAMLIVKAPDISATERDAQSLPYVREGVLTAQVVGLAPYPPLLERLERQGRTPPDWWMAPASE